jgi:hypothetical protein
MLPLCAIGSCFIQGSGIYMGNRLTDFSDLGKFKAKKDRNWAILF